MAGKQNSKSDSFRNQLFENINSASSGIIKVFSMLPENSVNSFFFEKTISCIINTMRIYDYSQSGNLSQEEFISTLRRALKQANDGLFYFNLMVETKIAPESELNGPREGLKAAAGLLGASVSTMNKKIKASEKKD